MNIFSRFARINHYLALIAVFAILAIGAPPVILAQQTVDPSGACQPESLERIINAQTAGRCYRHVA